MVIGVREPSDVLEDVCHLCSYPHHGLDRMAQMPLIFPAYTMSEQYAFPLSPCRLALLIIPFGLYGH